MVTAPQPSPAVFKASTRNSHTPLQIGRAVSGQAAPQGGAASAGAASLCREDRSYWQQGQCQKGFDSVWKNLVPSVTAGKGKARSIHLTPFPLFVGKEGNKKEAGLAWIRMNMEVG